MNKHTCLQMFAVFSATVAIFSVALSQSDRQATPQTDVTRANQPVVNTPVTDTSVVKSSYASDQARLLDVCGDIEEGKSYNFREALILSARQNVRRGEMSKEAYEQFTKEKFPE